MHHPTMFLMIMVAAAGTTVVHAHTAAANTPAAQFWERSLPDSPMPESVADLVRKGIDRSPLVEHYSALPSISECILVNSVYCNARTVAETGLFFRQTQLRPGSIMTVSFPAEDEPAILPHKVAEKVPFTNLEDVLATFNIPTGSTAAAQVRDTLSRCEAPPLAGEVKSCTTSLEATVQSAIDMLGGTSHGVRAITSELPRSGLPRQPYMVQAVNRIRGSEYVSCHKMSFPYAVYQCHATKLGYIANMVSLRGLHGGPTVDVLSYCHLDTSNWNPAHPAFEVLHSHPGGSPVCHFMPYADLGFLK